MEKIKWLLDSAKFFFTALPLVFVTLYFEQKEIKFIYFICISLCIGLILFCIYFHYSKILYYKNKIQVLTDQLIQEKEKTNSLKENNNGLIESLNDYRLENKSLQESIKEDRVNAYIALHLNNFLYTNSDEYIKESYDSQKQYITQSARLLIGGKDLNEDQSKY